MTDAPDDMLVTEDTDQSRPRRVITTRGVVIASARIVTGLVGLGVAAATVTAAAMLPLPHVRATPASTLVTPVPTAQQLVCAGAMLRLADDTGQGATVSSPLGEPTLDAHASAGAVNAIMLPTSDAGSGGTAAAPTVISIPPADAAGDPALLSGAQAQAVNLGDFVGLAASECRGVSGDLWLVGGSTAVGRTTLLTIANPTEVPATVDLELFGERGAITAPGTRGIVVAAGGQRVISLAGFQPGVAAPVVHLTSSGGQVVAHLQQSVLRVLDPGGIDIVAATRPPGLVNVIPGLRLTDAPAVEQLLGAGPDHLDTRTALRIFAPGEGTVSATVEVIADGDEPQPPAAAEPGGDENHAHEHGTLHFEFAAGRVTDVLLEELATGTYTVRVTTDRPSVAAVRVTTVADGVSDFAWIPAAPELDGRAQATIADGPAPVLHLASAGTAVEVAVDGASMAILAGSSISVPADAGSTIVLEASGPVHATVTFTGGGLNAGYPVHPPGRGSTPIRVY